MYLIEIFLPTRDNDGNRFARREYERVEDTLIQQFDGFTAHRQAPAKGLWKSPTDEVSEDDMVIYEVMTTEIDRIWWKEYRRRLESQFRQEQILVRSHSIEML
jgi:hypothetical protein